MLSIILLPFLMSLVATQQICETPNREPGRCIPYIRCGYLNRILEQFGNNPPAAISEYLRSARCDNGNNLSQIHICCKISDIVQMGSRFDQDRIEPNEKCIQSLTELQCGQTSGNRISNGEIAGLDEFPWMALLRYDSEINPFQCGGTLISHQYVLTAAHCVSETRYKLIGVRLGEYNLDTDKDCTRRGRAEFCNPPVEDFGIKTIIAHQHYNPAQLINDIGLIELATTVVFKNHIKAICLPVQEKSLVIEQDQKYFIAGWGTTEDKKPSRVLLKAVIPYQERQNCQNIFKRVNIQENHICAGGEDQIDACRGDSGGPLFFLAPFNLVRRFVQFGIVSFGGSVCGRNDTLPGVYTNVSSHISWITNNMNNCE